MLHCVETERRVQERAIFSERGITSSQDITCKSKHNAN